MLPCSDADMLTQIKSVQSYGRLEDLGVGTEVLITPFPDPDILGLPSKDIDLLTQSTSVQP